MSFFAELKRRNVFRVGIAYLVGAWVLAQVAELLLNNFEAPAMVMKSILVVLIIGFPLALFLAWAYELTPEGVKPEAEVDRSQSITPQTGRKLDRLIIALLVIALGYFAWDKFSTLPSSQNVIQLPSSQTGEPKIQVSSSQTGKAVSGIQTASSESTNGTKNKAGQFELPQPNTKSIAVLPFVNMSSDPEQEYFSDGITEEILNRLVSVPGLQVAARTSAFSFKGQNQDVRQIAQLLGVGNILEGSVRKAGEQVRITAQLIRAGDGFHLWSESYDRKLENIFAIQEDIAGQIAAALEISLGVSNRPSAQPAKLVNPEVYDLYLRARALHRGRGLGELEAIELFEQALAIDPDFAPAWAGLSHVYIVVPNYVSAADWHRLGDVLEKSMAAADRALQLDPNLPTALHAMGNNWLFRYEWTRAEDYYRRALELDPDSADIMEDYLSLLLYSWQTDRAAQVSERLIALDPNVPIFLLQASLTYFAAGDVERWEETIQKALLAGPELDNVRITDIIRLMRQGRVEDARAHAALLNPTTTSSSDMLALIDWMNDPAEEPGPAVLAAFRTGSAMLALLAGRYDVFMQVTEKAGQEWPEWELTESIDLLAPLAPPEVMHRYRADPRTKAWLTKMRLPEYWRHAGWPDKCRPIGAEDFECF